MTSPSPAALSAHTPAALRAALADAAVRRRIEGIVRRRVGPGEVEDVVQQVVCDALGSALAPDDPADIPRWLFGITRHKVADHHRGSRRREQEPLDAEEIAGRATPLEARSLLRGVMADAMRVPRGAETMEWLARESQGERLDEMAREVALPPATVRQRVSRLRRWLQRRWLTEALLVAAATALVIFACAQSMRQPTVAPIVADPLDNRSAAASAALQGRWRVQSVEPEATLDPSRRALVDAEALTTVVDVEGGVLHLASATRRTERRLEVGAVENGQFEVRVLDGGGVQRATATFDRTGHLTVVGTDGVWRGRVVLTR